MLDFFWGILETSKKLGFLEFIQNPLRTLGFLGFMKFQKNLGQSNN